MLLPVLLMYLFFYGFGDKLARAVEGAAYNPDPLYPVTFLCLFASALAGFFVGYSIARYIGSTLPTIWILERSVRLVPIEGTKTIFLSRGSRFYYYRRELGRTAFLPEMMSTTKDVDIKYGNNGNGSWMEKYVDKLKDSRHNLFAILSKKTRYEFLVPEGGVVTSLDPSKAKTSGAERSW